MRRAFTNTSVELCDSISSSNFGWIEGQMLFWTRRAEPVSS